MRLRRFVALGAALTSLAFGCSVIVSSELPAYRCSAGTGACPSGLTCDTASGRCVTPNGDASPDAPAAPDAEPEDADTDIDAGPRALGEPCRVNDDCASVVCGTSTILTTTITEQPGPICTKACCSSADCPSEFVCFNGGTGGAYCVPSTLAERTPPATGGRMAGATCSSNNDCRSGLCEAVGGGTSRCLDTCCTKSGCAAGTECRLRSIAAPGPAHTIWACSPANAGALGEIGQACDESSECKSDNCIGLGPGRICRPPCGSTADCRALPGFENGHCLYGSADSDRFRFCFSDTTATDDPAGASCVNDTTCQSDYCDAELRRCMNVCGRDRDCAANESCRPSAVTTPFLRCVPE